jgi:hypothetical protein
MIKELTWDEWCKEYPAIVVDKLPEEFEDKCDTQAEAQVMINYLEQHEDCFTTYRVVQFENHFYVVTKYYAMELTGLKEEDI